MSEDVTVALGERLMELEEIEQTLKARRRVRGIDYFVPNGNQLRAFRSKARHMLFVGGNRSSKSTTGAVQAISWATGKYPKCSCHGDWFSRERMRKTPNKGVIVVTSFPIIERVIEPRLRQYFPQEEVLAWKRTPQHYLRRIELKNGSFIDILTNEMDQMAFESADWDWAWIDEPTSKARWDAIQRGLLDRHGQTIFSFTPTTEPWMLEDLVDKADGNRIEVIQASTYENQFDIHGQSILAATDIREFEEGIDPQERATRIGGKFFHLKGVVYPTFQPSVHEWSEDIAANLYYKHPDPVICVLDPHDRKPHWVIWAWVDRADRLFVDRELKHTGDLPSLKRAILKLEMDAGYKVKRRIIDPNFGRSPAAVGAGKTVIQELARPPFGLAFGEVSDDITAGHLKVRWYLSYDPTKPLTFTNQPKLYFHRERCRDTIRSVRNLQYEEWRGITKDNRDVKEKEKDKDSDGAACTRYLCMSTPTFDRLHELGKEEDSFAEQPY